MRDQGGKRQDSKKENKCSAAKTAVETEKRIN